MGADEALCRLSRNRPGNLPPFFLLSRPLRCFPMGCAASAAPLAPAAVAPLLTAPAGGSSTAKGRDQGQEPSTAQRALPQQFLQRSYSQPQDAKRCHVLVSPLSDGGFKGCCACSNCTAAVTTSSAAKRWQCNPAAGKSSSCCVCKNCAHRLIRVSVVPSHGSANLCWLSSPPLPSACETDKTANNDPSLQHCCWHALAEQCLVDAPMHCQVSQEALVGIAWQRPLR